MTEQPAATPSILVVEDDLATAELVRTILNDVPGWGATVVHDAAAREVFKHVSLEVLVVDVNLPGITGIELLELLRRDPNWHEPPIILMSANANQPDLHDALQYDRALRFIRKPFDVDELVAAVAQAVAEQQPQHLPQADERHVGRGNYQRGRSSRR
jgi:CheY-like chemotaxis protein